ncbi:MAG: hypothetical protein CFE40_05500 [Burkholderiales bacterium PBB1]|nr:MAG: hypothetical protein CFE40_05500 [Burkholderiales bacterium PBB1]
MADTALIPVRRDLALKALHQVDALLPILQRQADDGTIEPDAMLGLLGRIRQMNDAAMTLLGDAGGAGDLVERLQEAVFGHREMAHR